MNVSHCSITHLDYLMCGCQLIQSTNSIPPTYTL